MENEYIDINLIINELLGIKKRRELIWFIPEKYNYHHYYDVVYFCIYEKGYLEFQCLFEEHLNEYVFFINFKNSKGDILYQTWFNKNDVIDIYDKIINRLDLKIIKYE